MTDEGAAPSMPRHSSLLRDAQYALLITAALLWSAQSRGDGFVDTLVRRFAHSDFEFLRAQSNAPFPPLAWIAATGYDAVPFRRPDGGDSAVTFQQTSASQAALLPIPIGQRDAIVVGEWLSWTHFDLDNADRKELEVFTAALPVGWVRQSSPDWQIAAFVAPMGHRTPEDDWYWETLGGFFARNVRGDRFAWIVGAYFDVSPLEDFYTPYLGATYIIDVRWTLNAVMPWPSITYAPTSNTLFRLGVTPSGASWSIEPGERRPRMNLTTWNVGVSAERRIKKSLWLGIEVGASCLRGLSIVGGDFEAPETKLSNTAFALVTLNLRPGSGR